MKRIFLFYSIISSIAIGIALVANCRIVQVYYVLASSLGLHHLGYFQAAEKHFRTIPLPIGDKDLSLATIRTCYSRPVDAVNPKWDEAIASVYGGDSKQFAHRLWQEGDIFRRKLNDSDNAKICYEKAMAYYSRTESHGKIAYLATHLAMDYRMRGLNDAANNMAYEAVKQFEMMTPRQFDKQKLNYLPSGLVYAVFDSNRKDLKDRVSLFYGRLMLSSQFYDRPIGAIPAAMAQRYDLNLFDAKRRH